MHRWLKLVKSVAVFFHSDFSTHHLCGSLDLRSAIEEITAEEQAQKAVEIARMAEGGPEYENMEDKAPKRVRAGN